MKVGIITIHNSPSYGACLQTYALWKYISMKGVDCEVIDLRRPTHFDYRVSKQFHPMRVVPISWLGKFYLLSKKIMSKIIIKDKLSLHQLRFKQFNEQIKMSRRYRGLDDIFSNPPQYDLYITGSDQVWNPAQPYCMEPYFLRFVNNPHSKRISYAASIGLDDLLPNEKKLYSIWLNDYDAIGVREESARELISSFSEKKTVRVLDPTFLLDYQHWIQLVEKPSIRKSFTLLFSLGNPKQLVEFAKKVARESETTLIILSPNYLFSDDYVLINNAGPQEFLGYFENAEIVITDSFHGTVFSMIMNSKNFFSYIGKGNRKGSRIKDILNLFHLDDHLLSQDLNDDITDLLSRVIDKNKLKTLINNEREKSMAFLDQYLYE